MAAPDMSVVNYAMGVGDLSPEAAAEVREKFESAFQGEGAVCTYSRSHRAMLLNCTLQDFKECVKILADLLQSYAEVSVDDGELYDLPSCDANQSDEVKLFLTSLPWKSPATGANDSTHAVERVEKPEDNQPSERWQLASIGSDLDDFLTSAEEDLIEGVAKLTGCIMQPSPERGEIIIRGEDATNVERAKRLFEALEQQYMLRNQFVAIFLVETANTENTHLRFVSLNAARNKPLRNSVIDHGLRFSTDLHVLRTVGQATADSVWKEAASARIARLTRGPPKETQKLPIFWQGYSYAGTGEELLIPIDEPSERVTNMPRTNSGSAKSEKLNSLREEFVQPSAPKTVGTVRRPIVLGPGQPQPYTAPTVVEKIAPKKPRRYRERIIRDAATDDETSEESEASTSDEEPADTLQNPNLVAGGDGVGRFSANPQELDPYLSVQTQSASICGESWRMSEAPGSDEEPVDTVGNQDSSEGSDGEAFSNGESWATTEGSTSSEEPADTSSDEDSSEGMDGELPLVTEIPEPERESWEMSESSRSDDEKTDALRDQDHSGESHEVAHLLAELPEADGEFSGTSGNPISNETPLHSVQDHQDSSIQREEKDQIFTDLQGVNEKALALSENLTTDEEPAHSVQDHQDSTMRGKERGMIFTPLQRSNEEMPAMSEGHRSNEELVHILVDYEDSGVRGEEIGEDLFNVREPTEVASATSEGHISNEGLAHQLEDPRDFVVRGENMDETCAGLLGSNEETSATSKGHISNEGLIHESEDPQDSVVREEKIDETFVGLVGSTEEASATSDAHISNEGLTYESEDPQKSFTREEKENDISADLLGSTEETSATFEVHTSNEGLTHKLEHPQRSVAREEKENDISANMLGSTEEASATLEAHTSNEGQTDTLRDSQDSVVRGEEIDAVFANLQAPGGERSRSAEGIVGTLQNQSSGVREHEEEHLIADLAELGHSTPEQAKNLDSEVTSSALGNHYVSFLDMSDEEEMGSSLANLPVLNPAMAGSVDHQEGPEVSANVDKLLGGVHTMLKLAQSHRGQIELRFDVGKIFVKSLTRQHTRPFPLNEWDEVFAGDNSKAAPTVTKMVTTSSADADSVVDIRTETGDRVFAAVPETRQITYEFVCVDRRGKQIIVEVDGTSFDYKVKKPARAFGSVFMFFPERSWDARVSLEGSVATIHCADEVKELVSKLYIAPAQTDVSLTTRVSSSNLRIRSVFCKRRTQHRFLSSSDLASFSSSAARPVLQITEVQDLIVQHHPTVQGALRAFANSRKAMIADREGSRLWYEVSLLSRAAQDTLRENTGLELAEKAGWIPHDVVTRRMMAEMYRILVDRVIKGLDGVGAVGGGADAATTTAAAAALPTNNDNNNDQNANDASVKGTTITGGGTGGTVSPAPSTPSAAMVAYPVGGTIIAPASTVTPNPSGGGGGGAGPPPITTTATTTTVAATPAKKIHQEKPKVDYW